MDDVRTHDSIRPWRFGIQASAIQLVALFVAGTSADGGTTLNACALASVLFWICAISLLIWRRPVAARMERFFLRWGLLAVALIGTPLLRPVVALWEGFPVLLLPSVALLLVAPLLYVTTRIFGLRSPFDEV